MTPRPPRNTELFLPLYVDYADDPKLENVTRDARLLYVDSAIRCKKLLTDGFISDAQLLKAASGLSPKKARNCATELTATGAFERLDDLGGWLLPAFLKRNKSRAQVQADQAEASDAGVRGNHERWHRDRISPTCPLCPGTEPDGSGTRSGGRSDTRSGLDRVGGPISSPETETETETRTPQPPASGGRSCTKHARHRRGCSACDTPANATVLGPPCGDCSPARRIEDAEGLDLGPCPACHPSARTA
jgi:hypothetical protein